MTEQKKVQTMKGLTDEEVRVARDKYGKNQLIPTKKESLFLKILEVLKEPMFLLLLVAAVIFHTWRTSRWHSNACICIRNNKY